MAEGSGRYVIALQNVREGGRLRLASGAIVEVVTNPEDGYWVLARYLSCPNDASKEGMEDMIFVYDVAEELGSA